MNEKRMCLVGHDEDNGWIFSLLIVMFIVACVIAIIFYGGAFIGGWHSLKNYVLAFKHNVVDSNRAIPEAA